MCGGDFVEESGRSLTGNSLTKMELMKRDVFENPDELIAFMQDLKKEREGKGP
ncbi:hypothetical protein [Methanoregula sp.]|uniref:hypothetical protein n=1 Tax=Methanoregula sp. TaxID=2052170 RepID=UPI0025D81EF7|nr:hypothetical protein [Methanoregula sp.]